ncbi:type IV secretion system DNA-binding domain-containing protein [Candidatus Wolfebacteria bacterium]|nr:type IV secretion system DNA-binding domain-containing protein [Candidatus Wolfebacteria bacterium]
MARSDKIHIIKYGPPPAETPQHGRADPRAVSFIGRTNYEGVLESKKFIFGIQREDRRRHIYVVGKTGVGKSKLLELLARQDIAYGYGLCLIDPHGEFIDDILGFIPRERIKDVVLIDPSDINFPISFNPLANVRPELKHQLAQGLIEVMEKQFGANWTPRLEHVFRFTVLALLDYPNATLRGMISMLTDRPYRQRVIEYIEDDMVKRFWAIEFDDWSEKFDTDAIIPLVNKLGQFLSNPLLRHIFAQKENTIDLEAIMASQKILLINLSKGKLGEENSSFFGSMFVTKLQQAGMARAAMPPAERKDFYIYADEFHNLVTATFVNLFTESRKYGLAMTVANQYLAQLLPAVQATVLGNVGTLVVFRVSGDDAEKLEPEMTPTFEAKDMINLGMQQFYIKMAISGESFDPFSAETLKVLPPPHESFKNEIMAFSRQTYSKPLAEVKKSIAEEERRMIFGNNETKSINKEPEGTDKLGNQSGGPPTAKNDMPEPLI